MGSAAVSGRVGHLRSVSETILNPHGSPHRLSLNSPAASFPCSLLVPAVHSPLSALATASQLLPSRTEPKNYTRDNTFATTSPTTVV
jgi:hypothetical protein